MASSGRVVRDGDTLYHRGTCRYLAVKKAYSDMIKFVTGSEMWVDAGQPIEGWANENGQAVVAPAADGATPRAIGPNQILLHKTERGLNWSTGPECILPDVVADYMHEDGTPIECGTAKTIDYAACIKAAKEAFVPPRKEMAYASYATYSAAIMKILPKSDIPWPRHLFDHEELPQRLFRASPEVKQAMARLEQPQYERAYARGIFGYEPETTWAAAAWALAEEIAK